MFTYSCGDEHSRASLDQRKVTGTRHLSRQNNIAQAYSKSLFSVGQVATSRSRLEILVFSAAAEANNIDSLKSDRQLTYLPGIYLSLRS